MKKHILLTITIFTVLRAYSQTDSTQMNNSKKDTIKASNSYTEQGGKFVGGMLNDIRWRHSSSYSQFGIQITPDFGYFIKENFAVGADISIGIYTGYIKSNYTYNSTSYGIGGFARYYKKITDKFLLFAHGGLSYTYATYVSFLDSDNSKGRSNAISCAISPGLVYFIFPRFGLEASYGNLHYNYTNSKNITLGTTRNYSDLGLSFNTATFFLGLNYYF